MSINLLSPLLAAPPFALSDGGVTSGDALPWTLEDPGRTWAPEDPGRTFTEPET